MSRRLLVISTFIPLCACGSMQGSASVSPPGQSGFASQPPVPTSPNSLWRPGAQAFFASQRAARVGDILTVRIDINDSASTKNSSKSNRTSSFKSGVTHFLGLETAVGRAMPSGFDPKNTAGGSSTSSHAGEGSVERTEQINLKIAAVVAAVLPNGNLVIQGSQEARTNTELRQLQISGIVRPEDISSTNTIRHTQIAEARISYGGRGDISRVQKVPAGQAIARTLLPF